MADLTGPSIQGLPVGVDPEVAGDGSAKVGASAVTLLEGERTEVFQVLEETLAVSKRRRVTGRVRVGTHTETVEATAAVDLDRYTVEVTRMPVGRVVEEVPVARAEGDTTIIPVVEERLVLVKQLFLVEELHVRHVVERRTVTEPVTLRRQRAVVERLNDQGGPGGPRASTDAPVTEP